MDFDGMLKPNIQEGLAGIESPSELRRMFLSVESGGNGDGESDSRCFLRPDYPDFDDRSPSSSETFKDVDMVFSLPNSFTITNDSAFNQHLSQVDHHGSYNASAFEFQKMERQQNRSSLPLVPKTAPSKWDDAQKWIASPTSNKTAKISGTQIRKMGGGIMNRGNKPFAAKMLEISEESDSKASDLEPSKMTSVSVNPVADLPVTASQHGSSSFIQCSTSLTVPPSTVRSVSMKDTGTEMTPIASQETSRTGTPMRDASPIRGPTSSQPSLPGRSALCSKPIDPADSLETSNNKELVDKELQMRTRREIMVLGTQLGKPNIAAWASREEADKSTTVAAVNFTACDQPIQSIIETRAAAWEEAEKAKNIAMFKREEMQIQAWEDHQKAEIEAKTKMIEVALVFLWVFSLVYPGQRQFLFLVDLKEAAFNQVKVERMRASAHERLMAKLAAARLKAEEKRLAAEARRNRRASRTARQVDYIRRTGRVPLFFSLCWGFHS